VIEVKEKTKETRVIPFTGKLKLGLTKLKMDGFEIGFSKGTEHLEVVQNSKV
jgi:hypothetical protein